MTTETESIESAKNNLDQATAAYDKAHQQSQIANRGETECKNRLNHAQKAFDRVIDEIKAEPPRDSDWWNNKHRPSKQCAG